MSQPLTTSPYPYFVRGCKSPLCFASSDSGHPSNPPFTLPSFLPPGYASCAADARDTGCTVVRPDVEDESHALAFGTECSVSTLLALDGTVAPSLCDVALAASTESSATLLLSLNDSVSGAACVLQSFRADPRRCPVRATGRAKCSRVLAKRVYDSTHDDH